MLLEFVGHTLEDADISEKGRTNTNAPEKTLQDSVSNVSFEDLMARIRHIVLTNRLRVSFINNCIIFLLFLLTDIF